jgi:hypothetical protein
MPTFTVREDDPESFHTFVATLDRNDEKTAAAYLTAWRPAPHPTSQTDVPAGKVSAHQRQYH